jgi:putative membrane protein
MSEFPAQMLSWFVLPAVTCTLLVTALVYLRGWISLRSAFPTLIAGWRLAAFLSGLTLVWAALGSPLAPLDHQSLTIHMAKHLLLMTVAAPLILMGTPMFPLACGLPKLFIRSRRPLARLLGRWFESYLRHPVLCWLAGTTAVIGWHLPRAFQLGVRSHPVHIFEDVSFLMAGLLFWSPVVHSSPSAVKSPRWSMVMYLFLATLPCDILSAFFVFCNRLIYPFYLSTPHLFSLPPLADQECAGALMWVWVTFAYLIPAVAISLQLLSPQNTRSQGSTQATPQGVAGRSRNGTEAEVI